MRIQHNVMAMNAYRNYNNNTSALSKNLEKLSSGYKINRAGDDAAGLAISEKMRAQITGLTQAQANAKSGINLVQTAEGALQEVHDMLNRMVKLADQSANGTYDNETDRLQLQKEVSQLNDEINRIADSANFNGIKLLDGSLSGTGSTGKAIAGDFDAIKGALAGGIKDIDAVESKTSISVGALAAASAVVKDGDTFKLSIGLSDGSTREITVTAKLDDKNNATFLDQDGNELTTKLAAQSATTAGKLTQTVLQNVLMDALKETDLGKDYTFTAGTATGNVGIDMIAKTGGSDNLNISSVGFTAASKGGTTLLKTTASGRAAIYATTEGKDKTESLDLASATVFDGKSNLDKSIFEVNGEKFVFVANGKLDDAALAALKEAGVSHYVEIAGTTKAVAADVTKMVEKIKFATGLEVEQGSNTGGVWAQNTTGTEIKLSDGVASKANGGLTLQIGDTSDDFNKLNVSIQDMHAKSLGIDGVDIGTQDGAAAAIDKIKAAINTVSDVRGTLGATQNRLDHTINNLSVMTENIQDAESTIRDTDVADEMMAYTKNNILIQSAQAMLAQANQVPQGVLQLLQ